MDRILDFLTIMIIESLSHDFAETFEPYFCWNFWAMFSSDFLVMFSLKFWGKFMSKIKVETWVDNIYVVEAWIDNVY